MFSLVQGFYEEITYVPERKVALLGVESAGKTSVLAWVRASYEGRSARQAGLESVTPTVGLNVARLKTGPERLLLWDLGGAKALRPIWERYVEDAEALIWVVDASDATRLEESASCLRELMSRKHLIHSPLLVLANKQDADDAMDAVKTSLALDLLSDAEMRPQCVQPTSAVTGQGIREGVDWLLQHLRNPSTEVKTSIKGT